MSSAAHSRSTSTMPRVGMFKRPTFPSMSFRTMNGISETRMSRTSPSGGLSTGLRGLRQQRRALFGCDILFRHLARDADPLGQRRVVRGGPHLPRRLPRMFRVLHPLLLIQRSRYLEPGRSTTDERQNIIRGACEGSSRVDVTGPIAEGWRPGSAQDV